jgi:hypothetical protein
MMVEVAIDPCGGRDGERALGSSSRVLELALKDPGPISGEVVVRALAAHHARTISQQ